MIQNLINNFFFFWKHFFGHTTFLYSSTRSSGHHQSLFKFPHVPVDIIRVFFFNFRFFSRKSQSQQKQSKKITHCTIQKTSLILWTSTYYVSVWCQKKHLHSTIFWRPKLHSWSSLKANVRIFLYISVSKVLFQSLSKILSDGEWVGGETE